MLRAFAALSLVAAGVARCSSEKSCLEHHDAIASALADPWHAIFKSFHLDALFAVRNRSTYHSAPTKWCPHDAAYEFIPATAAALAGKAGASANWTASDGCFHDMKAIVVSISNYADSERLARVRITGINPTGRCNALYAVGTSYTLQVVELATDKLSGTIDVNVTSASAWDDVAANGLTIFLLPCGPEGTLSSILATAKLFIGSNNETSAANAEMLAYRGVWPSPFVPFGRVVPIDEASITSGTYLSIMELTGTDAMQALGTGPSGTGHSAVAVWRNGTLFVCESTYNLEFYGNGIMATEWATWWKKNGEMAGRMAAILTLADEYRTIFDENAFWTWFDTVKGTPYGFNNYLFSGEADGGGSSMTTSENSLVSIFACAVVLDTADPFASFPLPIDNNVLTTVLNVIATFLPNKTGEQHVGVALQLHTLGELHTLVLLYLCAR